MTSLLARLCTRSVRLVGVVNSQSRHTPANILSHHHLNNNWLLNKSIHLCAKRNIGVVNMTSEKPKIVFVLGAPGAGKGTQCTKIVEEFGFVHLSAGDLLREERQREGSEFGELIEGCIRDGTIVPVEVTCALLENTMNKCIAVSIPL